MFDISFSNTAFYIETEFDKSGVEAYDFFMSYMRKNFANIRDNDSCFDSEQLSMHMVYEFQDSNHYWKNKRVHMTLIFTNIPYLMVQVTRSYEFSELPYDKANMSSMYQYKLDTLKRLFTIYDKVRLDKDWYERRQFSTFREFLGKIEFPKVYGKLD